MPVSMLSVVAIARHPTMRVAVAPMAVSMLVLRNHLPLELLRLRMTPVLLLQHRIVVLTRCKVGKHALRPTAALLMTVRRPHRRQSPPLLATLQSGVRVASTYVHAGHTRLPTLVSVDKP